ncbi:MAG: adenosylcobinamide-phosphate synthase CbiB [Gammaproteobacteria bacterium]|nr:adenosylcobinamide-phosphate synthase CbiB [Gammaproteobacteria bacterium]
MIVEFLPVLVCVAGLLGDRVLGEPGWHPLEVFGRCAMSVEKKLNNRASKARGAAALTLLLVVPVGGMVVIQQNLSNPWIRGIFDTGILVLVIGWQSMKEHAIRVVEPLIRRDLDGARQSLSMIVSRETGNMNPQQVVGSTMESVLENGHDCVVASLFWYALLGPAGAVLHRLVNTLDAMWGYRNARFQSFGWAAARLDDILGWMPARLTAICYGLAGSFPGAMRSWKRQIGQHKSPNAGLVMASGAGALGVTIGGPVVYEGKRQDKPWLGGGEPAQVGDIGRAIQLVERSLAVWMVSYALVWFLYIQYL